MRPGIVIETGGEEPPHHAPPTVAELCDYCGSAKLEWRKCKLVCTDCRQISKSCADL